MLDRDTDLLIIIVFNFIQSLVWFDCQLVPYLELIKHVLYH